MKKKASLPNRLTSCCTSILAPLALATLLPSPALALSAPIPPEQQGFFSGSHAGLKLRSYNDHLTTQDRPDRNASVLGAQAWIASGWTPGPLSFSASASLFSALTLGTNSYAGNMAHAGSPDSWKQRGWSYPGLWDIQARAGGSLLKYGLLLPETDAYLVPHDNRALPPTFRGGAFTSQDVSDLKLIAGSFDKVVPRGQSDLKPLTTEYSRAPVSRFSYLGGAYRPTKDAQIVLSGAQARDVWNQYYVSAQRSIGDAATMKWTLRGDYYHTSDTGKSRGGEIRNDAYSFALTARHEAHAVTLAFQQILGDQFFDYMGESADDRLANSMDVDYNAPHERSIQLRYAVDLRGYGVPGLSITVWGVKGWGADAGNMANRLSPGTPRYDLYWSGGEPVHGSHSEIGMIPAYLIQTPGLRGSVVTLSLMHHMGSAHYSDPSSNIARLVMNVPLTVF